MSNTIIELKHSQVTGNAPATLANGEISINTADGKFYYKTPTGTITNFDKYPGPSGLNGEIQFNDLGELGASSNLSFNKTTGVLSVLGGLSVAGLDVKPTINTISNHANGAFDKANSSIILNNVEIRLGNTANLSQIWGTSYHNPNMVRPLGTDNNWGYGMHGEHGEYFLQAKFYGDNSANNGFRLFDSSNGQYPFIVDGTGRVVLNGTDIVPFANAAFTKANNALTFAANLPKITSVIVPGHSTITVDDPNLNLTLEAGSGINITTNNTTKTIKIETSAQAAVIFVDGADFGTTISSVVDSTDLGFITSGVTSSINLGALTISGLISPSTLILPSFTVATLPNVSPAAQMIFVSDESGGAVLAFSDGTNWRRTTDRAIVT